MFQNSTCFSYEASRTHQALGLESIQASILQVWLI